MRTLFSLFFAALAALVFTPSAQASAARGTLVVVNQRNVDVLVIADGRAIGPVERGVDQAFRLSAGSHDVAISARGGELIQQSRIALAAGAVMTLVVAPANGAIDLYNGAGTSLVVTVDGQSSGLASGQSRTLTLKPGEHRVRAVYTQLGRERVLSDERVVVSAGGRTKLRFAPVSEGLVSVENRTGREATLLVDGKPQATLRSGESTEVVTRLGRVSLTLSDRGRTLAQTSLAVGAYQDLRWSAAAPAFGALLVSNPLPITVLVEDSRGRTVTVAAHGRVELSGLPVGLSTLTARRASGEQLGRVKMMVDPYDVGAWTVPAPTSGFVALSNRGGEPVNVWIDGARTLNLAPRSDASVNLSLGTHRVQVRDTAGRLVLDTRVSVSPYDESLVAWSTGASPSHHGDSQDHGNSRDRHGDRDDHRGSSHHR